MVKCVVFVGGVLLVCSDNFVMVLLLIGVIEVIGCVVW